MRLLIYALQFRGEAQRTGIDGNVLKTTSSAPGCTIRSRIGAEGLTGSLRHVLGGEARLESELVLTGAATFQEAGTIVFATGGHRLRFSTVGSGHLDSAPEANRRHGAAIWRVEGGEGQFTNATGLIVSNFVMSDAGEIMDHHFGVVFVQ